MGYMKHDTIVVTAWDEEHFTAIHAKAKEILGVIVSPILGPFTNGQVSFFVAPDGSKEGWETSDAFDTGRAEFLQWLQHEAQGYADALVVRFGGDDDELSVRVVESQCSIEK